MSEHLKTISARIRELKSKLRTALTKDERNHIMNEIASLERREELLFNFD